jgi:hypothetical protein
VEEICFVITLNYYSYYYCCYKIGFYPHCCQHSCGLYNDFVVSMITYMYLGEAPTLPRPHTFDYHSIIYTNTGTPTYQVLLVNNLLECKQNTYHWQKLLSIVIIMLCEDIKHQPKQATGHAMP